MKTPTNPRKTLQIYWRYTAKYKRDFYIGAVGAVLANVTQNIIPPYIVARTFSKLQVAYAQHSQLEFKSFAPYIIGYAIAMIIGAFLWRLQSFFVWQYEIKVRRDMANDVYNHLQAQSQRFHADHFGGALVSQTNKFLGSYERLMDDFIWNIVPGITTLLFGVGVLLFVSTGYALVLSVIAVVYITIMAVRVKKQLPFNVTEAAEDSLQTAALADAVTNLSTVRAFAQEAHESAVFGAQVNRSFLASRRLSVAVMKTEAISHFQTNGFQIVAVLAGLIAVTHYGASASVLYLVITYTQNIVNQLWQFSRIIRNVNRSFGDATEMTEILGHKPEIQDAMDAIPAHITRAP